VLSIALPELPLPGQAATELRLRRLADLARTDLVVARLGEGHADAVAIRAELGAGDIGVGERWGVWAAAPHSVRAEPTEPVGGSPASARGAPARPGAHVPW
jgi:hypothetical protein